jgi:hypothetical protein
LIKLRSVLGEIIAVKVHPSESTVSLVKRLLEFKKISEGDQEKQTLSIRSPRLFTKKVGFVYFPFGFSFTKQLTLFSFMTLM